MKFVFWNKIYAVSCFLGSLFCLGIWYKTKNRILILDDHVFLILRESPHQLLSVQTLSVPLWSVNLIAGLLLVFTLFLIVPVLQRHKLHLIIFAVLCAALLLIGHIHYEKLLLFLYQLLLGGISIALCVRGLVSMKLSGSDVLRYWFYLYRNFHIVGYLLGTALCFLFGYWAIDHLVFSKDQVFLILREFPYQAVSVPLWGANLIAGLLLLFTLFLITPALQQRRSHFIIFAVLLLVVTLPLYAHIKTERFNYKNLLLFSYQLILNGIGIALCFRGLVNMIEFSRFHELIARFHELLTRFFSWIRGVDPLRFVLGLSAICVLVCCFISWRIFNGAPGFTDSCAYMFQAHLFAQGNLSAPLPPEPDFFEVPNVLVKNKWYSQYPPGHPALLALGVLFGIPWAVNPILGALTIICIYMLAKELYGDGIAKLSAVLASASSFFLLMSSEFMSHCSTLFFVTLAFLSFAWIVKGKRPLISSVVCGASLGLALLCRPYTTVWICIPMGIAAIVKRKKLSLRHILIGAVPLIIACLVFFVYNYATTGHPLLFGYIALHGKGHYPGFHLEPGGERFHTVAQGFKYLLGNLNALNYHLFEWPIPSLLFICILFGFGKKRFWEWLLVGWIGTLLIGHFFYYFNRLAFGPRFVYESLPALIILTSQGIVLSIQFLASWKQTSYTHARNVFCLVLGCLFLFAFLFNVPATAKSYRSYGGDIFIQKYLVKTNVERALVFIKGDRTHWVHYPFNMPFASPHIYAKDKGFENIRLAKKFPGYRYFIVDDVNVTEVSISELQN